VQKAIDKFFTVHLLHWIEVLALTGNLGVGVYAMNDIEQWYDLVSIVQNCSLVSVFMIVQAGVVSKWTNDSQHFLLEHFDTIQNSPSHIYHSALPFSPSSSWLHKCYSAELSHMVKVVKGLPAEWGMCSRTVLLNSLIWASHTITTLLQLGLNLGISLSLMQSLAARQLFFLDIQMK
jgi:hypothetical protein